MSVLRYAWAFFSVAVFLTLLLCAYINQGNINFIKLRVTKTFQYKVNCNVSTDEFLYDSRKHICVTSENQPLIWTYWDGSQMPAYINLSIETIKCHNNGKARVIIGNSSYADKLIDNIHPAFHYLSAVHRADYFRGCVLLQFGGMWIDADTVMWSSPERLFDLLEVNDLYGYTWPPERAAVGITVMGPIRAGTELMFTWKKQVDDILTQNFNELKEHSQSQDPTIPYPIVWNELLYEIIVPLLDNLVEEKRLRYYSVNGIARYGQLEFYGFNRRLFDPLTKVLLQRLKREINNETEFLLYHNSRIAKKWKKSNVNEFMRSDVLLVCLFKMSFERCASMSTAIL